MNKQIKTEGVVIRKINLNEADQILTVLTKDMGKIHCIAKGARRLKSKFCGRLELFYQVELTAYRGRSLENLNEVDIVKATPLFDLTLGQHGVLFFIAEVTQKLIQDSQQVEGVYAHLLEALHHLQEGAEAETILHAYLLKLFTLAGFLAPWDTCPYSNEKHNLDQPLFFSIEHGGVIAGQYAKPEDVRLPAAIVKWVNFIQKYPLPAILKVQTDQGDRRQTWNVIQAVLQDLFRHPLKSEVFLEEIIT